MREAKKTNHINGRKAVTDVLRCLEDASFEAGELFQQWARREKYYMDPDERLAEKLYWEQVAFRKRLKYMRQKKLIQTKKTEKGLLYELSGEGRVELLKRIVCERPILPNQQVCLVVYDIPVEGGSGRDALRYFLKRIGFQRVQKSVWQTNKDIVQEVLDFIDKTQARQWVQIYLGCRLG